MNDLIRKLTPPIELFLVLILGFGLFLYSSTRGFFFVSSNDNHSWLYKVTTRGELYIVIYEVIALLIILHILRIRNWKLADFNLDFTFKMFWIGILIMFIRDFIAIIGFKLFEFFNVVHESTPRHVQYRLESNWIGLSLIIIVNSVYEEFILVGYFFKRLEKYHIAIVIGLSTLIRLSYHTYQGWMGLLMIIPTGLVFGYYYYRYKKLWPLIIAHGFWNLIVFLKMHFNLAEKIQN
jgi:membrane protease YdiL (CAAX protease family)